MVRRHDARPGRGRHHRHLRTSSPTSPRCTDCCASSATSACRSCPSCAHPPGRRGGAGLHDRHPTAREGARHEHRHPTDPTAHSDAQRRRPAAPADQEPWLARLTHVHPPLPLGGDRRVDRAHGVRRLRGRDSCPRAGSRARRSPASRPTRPGSRRSRPSAPACARRTSSSSPSPNGDVTEVPAVRAAMARVAAANPGRADEFVLLDRQRRLRLVRPAHDFEEVYLPGRDGIDRKSGAVEMRAVAAAGLPAGVTVDVTGRARRSTRRPRNGGGGSSVLLEAVIGGIGALLVLLFVFGTLPAVLMPLVVAVASILNTFTLVWALTYVTDVSIIVQFLIALVGLGVAIDYALLMIFRFRDELREGNDVESALVETMTHAGRSVIISGTTVALGLLVDPDRPAALAALDEPGRHADPVRVGARRDDVAAGTARGRRPADQQRPGDAETVHRPRSPGGRALGTVGPLRDPAPGRGRPARHRHRRAAGRARDATEPERGPAEVLPGHRNGDRRTRPTRLGRHQPRRDEAARRPRQQRRRRRRPSRPR